MADLTITQMSKKYRIKTDTLRYYERIGLLPPVPRKANGNRYYNEGLQDLLEMIICLRHSDVPVETLIDYTQLLQQGDATLQARQDLLEEQLAILKEKQAALQRAVNRLAFKVKLYQTGEIKKNKNYFHQLHIMDDGVNAGN